MSILEDMGNNRVANVKTMATRVAKFGEGFSVREFLDSLALASGSLIRAVYRGPAIEVALDSFIEELRRASHK
jgi:hypothetical protein